MSKLYSNGVGNVFAQTALIAADLANQQVEVVYMSEEDRKNKDWAAKHLTGKFPVLETDTGDMLWESGAIARHFARQAPASGLLGQSAFETAKVDEWVAFAQSKVWVALMPVVKAALGHTIIKADEFTAGVKELKAVCKVLNDHLKDKHFLVGDNLTIADVVVSCSLIVAYQTVLDAGFRKGFAAVSEWFQKCMGLPSFVRRLGYIKMTEKPMKQFDPSAKPAPVAAAAPAKKGAAKKEDDVEMDDLFGDDDDDGAAAKAAAAKAKEKTKKKEKKPVIAQSLVMFEIKPLDSETNLDDVAKRVLAIKKDGVYWKTEFKKVPVAFGIFKLIMGVTVEDEKVSVDGLVEDIEAFDDMVQSVEIMAFNKI